MRKTLSLILALCLGCVISFADTNYTVGVSLTTLYSGARLSGSNDPIRVTLESAATFRHQSNQSTLPDGTAISTFGSQTISISNKDSYTGTSSRIKMVVNNNNISNLIIYFTGPDGDTRKITLEDANGNKVSAEEYGRSTAYYINSSGSTEWAYIATVSSLPSGTYYISTSVDGGFIGLKYTVVSQATRPTNPAEGVRGTTQNTTWSFSDVSGNGKAETGTIETNNKDAYYSYAYFYGNGYLTYNNNFPGEYIAFLGQYPIRKNKYAQNGTLAFKAEYDGAVRVTFTDTGTEPSESAHRRYLAVNKERTDYWTSREKTGDGAYSAQLDVTSGYIPVKAGYVYIDGMTAMGANESICVTKVEYIRFYKENDPGTDKNAGYVVGVTLDTFTERVIEYKNSKSVSTWTYGGYKHSTHGLVGGVEDNGILYYSSSFKADPNDKNSNGNISFNGPDGSQGEYFLSCAYGSTIYVPVRETSPGTITLTCTQNDYNNNGTGGDRYFELQKEGYSGVRGHLALKRESSLTFTSDDISYFNGGYYLKLVAHFDEKYYNEHLKDQYKYTGEMKVYSVSVALDKQSYQVQEVETDYEHNMGEEHTHAVFNWTEGDVYTNGYHYGTLTMRNGAMLTGINPDAVGTSSGTETIHSYRNGDIVKYKTNYYGGLQLLSGENTVYTITPPPGYYITTSVRIHGHYNKNTTDTDDGLGHNTYISSFGDGKWENYNDNPNDDTYIRFPRDDDNARTTTLDFTVPASESVDFQVSGYQIFGIIDAVLVPKEAVPALERQLYYHYDDKINVDVTEHPRMRWGGTINYTPNEGEELWWYYEPLGSKIASRGRWEYSSNESLDDYPVDGPGVKDQNITKKFSVLNYKFVNATGTYHSRTDNLEQDVYNVEDNYIPSSPSDISTMADGPSADGSVSLTIGQAGTYYFYIHDKTNNYNSPLGIVTFDNVTGVEDITVEDNYETDDLYAPVYNIFGQRVDSSYRGIVICNGRKYVRK